MWPIFPRYLKGITIHLFRLYGFGPIEILMIRKGKKDRLGLGEKTHLS
jgi:hypothetical protein